MEKNKSISSLINKALTKPQKVTIQKEKVINTENEEVQFSFYIEKPLLKQFKLHATEMDDSMKNIITTALKNYLNKK
ncbi:hypothetical protein [Polaribacter ponticola]|uniref:CopG family transcriptional regulator n=1 Tax=Polaribacter ponticola TaxID=2978475 RepID=A0ABT5SBI8_9FLAO|nr:hypothetical protein [Polaribacter sp. MSW5]MDD7915479.1 hypothetical protein [Polaribacter sp. MSW5]